MKLIVGLGNPGEQYTMTRHNIGFSILSALIEQYNFSSQFNKRFNSIISTGTVQSNSLAFLMPQTYMNRSGEAIVGYMRYYKIPLHNLLVIYDDIAIHFGSIKFKRDGRDAGHNGIKSIIQNLGTDQFLRLKVGIGPDPGGALRSNFVLSKFTSQEVQSLDIISQQTTQAVEICLFEGLDKAMNLYNKANFLEKH